MKNTPDAVRFSSKVAMVPEAGCWLWTGAVDDFGYGWFKVAGALQRSHRFAWQAAFGAIPSGMCVLHKCDTPSCVNPAHLFLGTRTENNADKYAKGRENRCSRNTGSAHGLSKLSEADIPAIRVDSRSQEAIAADYGVSRRAIGMVKNGQTWAHVA